MNGSLSGGSRGSVSGQQHFIKFFSYTTKYFWLLVIPLLRSLYSLAFSPDALGSWLRGSWLDIIVLLAIIAFAWLRLISVSYSFDGEKIEVRRGIIAVSQDVVFYSQISTLSLKQGIFYCALGAVKVYVATNAGIFDRADITLVMKKRDADRLYLFMKRSRVKSLGYSVSPNKPRLLIFSLLFSSTLSGVLVALAFIMETSQVFDREAEAKLILDTLSEFANRLAHIIPPAAAGVSAVILISWLTSFITNLFYFWDYIITKTKDSIYIKSGLIAKNRHIIYLERVNYIDLRQSMLAMLLRVSSLHCHCSGYGSTGRSELSVVLPITPGKEVRSTIREVFPDYPSPELSVKSSLKALGGFYFWPAAFSLIPLAGYIVCEHFMTQWHSVALTAFVIAELPVVWLAVTKTLSLFITGVGIKEDHIVLRYLKGYGFHTVIAPIDRVTKVVIRQTVAQTVNRTCTVIVYTASDSRVKHKIYGIELDRALRLFEGHGFDLYFNESPSEGW